MDWRFFVGDGSGMIEIDIIDDGCNDDVSVWEWNVLGLA
jgi:hypothetical protein